MKLKVPFFKQDTPYTCGPVALQMALAFFGVFEGGKQLAKEVHVDHETGTKHKWMMEVAEKKGFYCYEKNESTLDDVCSLLEQNLPVIVYFIEPSEDDIHYSIITGIEKGVVTLNDPWNGEGYRIPELEFLDRWECKGGHYVRWLMAISREPISLHQRRRHRGFFGSSIPSDRPRRHGVPSLYRGSAGRDPRRQEQ